MLVATTGRAVIVGVLVLVGTALLPGLVLAMAGLSAQTSVATLGILSGLFAALLGGPRAGVLLAGPLALATGLAVAVSHDPWLAALLMLVVVGTRGWLATRGLHVALTTAAVAVGFIVSDPPAASTSVPEPLMAGMVMLVGTLYGAGVVALVRLKRPMATPPQPLSTRRAWAFTIATGVTVAAVTWAVVRFDVGHTGAWVILTLLVVLQPYVQDGIQKALQRAGGTVVGFAAVYAIGLLTGNLVVLYLAGMAALVLAIVLSITGRPYWSFAGALTAAIVLLEGASSSVTDTAVHRLGATVIGVAVALIVTALEQPWAKRAASRYGASHY